MAMNPPALPRRHFLTRLLGAITGGAWLGAQGLADKAEAGVDATPFLGEIRMFAGWYEPWGWRICDGRLLDIGTYESLFNLIGTRYGGDGVTTFALPDLRGRVPVHVGSTALGEMGGQETVTLVTTQIPAHAHSLNGGSALGDSSDPTTRVPSKNALGSPHYGAAINAMLAPATLMTNGASQPHENLMPSLCVHFIICIQDGTFPSEF
jgi:microcystin-dependent protein